MEKKREYNRKKTDLEDKKNEVNREIELSFGFEELRRGLGDFEEAE